MYRWIPGWCPGSREVTRLIIGHGDDRSSNIDKYIDRREAFFNMTEMVSLHWIRQENGSETATIWGWVIVREWITLKYKRVRWYTALHPLHGSGESANFENIKKLIHSHTQAKMF